VNYPDLVNKNFMNFLERRIRLKFGFMGAPIKLIFKERRR
jgi:predicted GTPase